MRRIRLRYVATVAAAVVLAGCTASGSGAESPDTAATTPATGSVSTESPECRDGLPVEASIAPGSIGIAPSSWPADSSMADIRGDRKLVVGVSGDAVRWGFSDAADRGALKGFDVEVAQQIADTLDVPLEVQVLPLSARIGALKAGDVDLVVERFSMTCDRWQGSESDPQTYINFSSQYYEAGQRLLIRKDLRPRPAQIENLTAQQPICAVAGSTSLANAQKLGLKAPLVVAADSGQCLVKFQEGEVVGITADDTTLAGFTAQDTNAEIVGRKFTKERYGIGVNHENTDLTRYVNAVLEQMRSDGTLRRLGRDFMARDASPVPAPLYGRDVNELERAG